MEQRLRQDAERAKFGDAYLDQGLVFSPEGGGHMSPEYVTKLFPKLATEAGVRRIRLHDLRHGAASLMLAAGIPIEVVSKRLGHGSYAITMNTYSHLLAGVGRHAAEAAMALVPRTPVSTGGPTLVPQEAENDEAGSPSPENPLVSGGTPPGTRTLNPLIKSQLLCQLS